MNFRPAFAQLLLALACSAPALAWAQQVQRLEAEPAGLQPLAVRVSGRVQALPDGSLRRQWPGTYVEAAFVGSEAYFRVAAGDVNLRVRVDGGAPIPLVKPAAGLYRIGVTGAAASHRLRIDVVSEHQGGPTTFGPFFLPAGARAATLPARSHQVEFIGDSHTVGYGNTSASRECSGDELFAHSDTSVGVAPKVAARFDADYQVNAISGRGIVRNFNGGGGDPLPKAYPFVLFDKAAVAGDPAWRPQAIVISLGTNDFSMPLNAGEKWGSREQLQADFVATYARFVGELQRRQPQAYVLLWAAGSADAELATQARKVVQQVQPSGEPKIGFVAVPDLSASGCHWHPSVADDQRIAAALTRHLEAHAPALGKALAEIDAGAPSVPVQAAAQTPAVGDAGGQPINAAASAPPAARAEGKPVGRMINDWKTATTWFVYGANQRTESMAQGGPKDYPMTRVTVSAQGNPWDVGAASPVGQAIQAGDTVLVTVYLRAPELKDGESTPVSYLGLNESSAPYGAVARGSAEVTNQWKAYRASGVAAKAYSPEQVTVGLQLAAARHVVDLGPVLVHNFGPGVDLTKLPR